MVHSSQAFASHARDSGTGTNTIIEDIFAATSVPTSYSHTYAPERSLIQALGADDLFSAAQRI